MVRLLRLFPQHWPIGLKLFALITTVAVVPLVVGFYLNYQESKQILLEQNLRQLDVYSEQVAQNLDAYLAHRLDEVRSVAEDATLQTMEGEQRLAALLRLHPEFLGVTLVDRSGAVRLSVGRNIFDHLGGRGFFARVLAGSPAVSRPFSEGGLTVLAFAAPVKTRAGEVAGAVVVYTPAEAFWKIIEGVRDKFMPGSVAIVSDRSGIRLAHSTRRDLIFQAWAPLPEAEARELLARQEFGSDIREIPGTDLTDIQAAVRNPAPPRQLTHRLVIGGIYHSTLIPLKQVDWIMLHSVPEESLYAPLQDLRRKFLLYLALVLALAVLVSLAATWYALRPVQLLIQAAERVRAGDFSAQVALRRRDEIGALAETFNDMVKEIQAGQAAIEQSLQQTGVWKQYYEGILQEATVMVFMMGADGRVKYANCRAEEVLGYAPGGLEGMTCEALHAVQDEQFHQRFVRMFADRGDLKREELALKAHDGSIRYITCSLTTLVNPSGALEAAVFGLDVTEERAVEEKWERVEKLASLGQLAAGVAHEMKNYLTPIVGYADLLRECGALSEEGRLGVGRIMQGVRGLQRLVRQLTGFARPSEGELLPVTLSSLIEEVIAFFQKDLTRQRISTELRVEPVPPVLADPGGLEQILLNLVTNALQAMQGGGVLRVSTRRGLEGLIEVSVEDTGRGIPEDLLPRLFTPFFTTKPPEEGTGLGLFICRQIAERMGGKIEVQSRPGEGATFVLSLQPAG